MSYEIYFENYALKQLKQIDKEMIKIIKEGITSLSENPRPFGYIKLKGIDAYRIRIGNYRIIYEIEDNMLIIKVIAIAHRKDVYN
jgi:mRNA interferase RelE/StbE